jgi:hypothetical protein
MARDKIYVPVDPQDVILLPPPPRGLPGFLVERSRKSDRRALTLVSAAAGGALGGALMGGWIALVALPLCIALGALGFWTKRSASWMLRVARDGQAIPAKVCIDLGGGPTEVKYAPDERDVSYSGNLAVLAGDPANARVRMDYEYAGRIWSVQTQVAGEGKPAAVRLHGKVGCAVLVHAAQPGRPLLITQKMAKEVKSSHA